MGVVFLTKTLNCIPNVLKNGFSNQIVRFSSGNRECDTTPQPRCIPENLAKTECAKNLAEKREKEKKNTIRYEMWDKPWCCKDPCPDVYPRFDDLYYKPDDLATRRYTITWRECPDVRIVKKHVCCFEVPKFPPIKRRNLKHNKKSRCQGDEKKLGLMSCKKKLAQNKCPKIIMPGCRPAREKLSCKPVPKKPANCKKRCTPFPSYSECLRDPAKPLRPTECNCIRVVPMCEVYEYLRKMIASRSRR